MTENEEFLTELKQKQGKTNLGDYFDRFQMQKQNGKSSANAEHTMLPPQMMGN